MKILVTENQYRKLLLEESSNEVKTKLEKMSDFFKMVNKEVKESIGMDLQFSASWGISIAGFIGPIVRFIKGEFAGLTKTDISLIATGIIFHTIFENKQNFKRVQEEISNRGLSEVLKLALDKAKTLKGVFTAFIHSFAIPALEALNILAYAFIIPILPDMLNFAMGNPSMSFAEFSARVLSYFPLKYTVTVLKRLLRSILTRFKG